MVSWASTVIAGRDPQLDKAIEIVMRQLKERPPQKPQRPPFPVRVRRGAETFPEEAVHCLKVLSTARPAAGRSARLVARGEP